MIRVPFTSLHAPWVLLSGVFVALVLTVATAGALIVLRPPVRLLAALAYAVVAVKAIRRALLDAAPRTPSWLRSWRMRRRVKRVMADADWWWEQASALWTVTERRQFAALLAGNDKRAGRP